MGIGHGTRSALLVSSPHNRERTVLELDQGVNRNNIRHFGGSSLSLPVLSNLQNEAKMYDLTGVNKWGSVMEHGLVFGVHDLVGETRLEL